MPDSLHIRVGETRQLRPPPEGVGRWTSSAPTVVTTTDENLVTNKSGGLITAIKTGQAKIIAYGYDNKTKVMELDIEVELGRDTATIRVAKNETADLPQTAGLTRWTITNPRVAEMMGDNRVRGISPGITSARGEGNDAVECAIEVTGSIDVGVGQSVRLAELFAPPVKAWRTSCPTEVEIDARGTVMTGDRARTVEVSVELVSGRVFTFNLRIMGASSSRPSPQIRTVAIESERIASPSTVSETILPGVSPTPQPGQQQMVEALIAEAEVHMVADDWMQAGAKIIAARLAAATDPDLCQRVERINERIRAGVNQRAGAIVVDAVRLIATEQYEDARRRLDSARVPRDSASLVDSVRRLATLSEQFALDADDHVRDEVDRQLEVVWGGLLQMGFQTALPTLAEMGMQSGERIIPLLLDALCNPTLVGMPVAVRQALGKMLGNAGPLGLESAIAKLADGSTPLAVVSALLNLLPDLHLQKHATCVVKFYRHAGAATRERLVERVAALHTNMAGVLFDLLAGVLNRMPPDPGFAKAIQTKIRAESGARHDELEAKASVWAGRGNRNAQIVLQRLYDYDAKAFAG